MSLVSAFVLVWVTVIAVWLILDWLGDPNHGPFRPQSDRVDRERVPRRERRAHRRDREDAAVRTVLRDRYGRSSLRLHWSDDEEASAVAADEDLVTQSHSAAGLDRLAVRPPADSDAELELFDGQALDLAEVEKPEPEPTDESEPEPTDEPTPTEARQAAGWTIGDEPLAPTRSGKRPTATTVRARVWKNLAVLDDANWDADNRDRMRSGKAPRRRNPTTGRSELAVVDTDTGLAAWPDTALDPFGDEAE